jgi:heavy metal sensor kinase
MPRKFIQEIGNLDPIEARRLEFSARVNRPRVFRINGSPMGGPPDQQPFDPYALTTSFHGAVSVDTVNLDGHRLRVRSVPLTQDGHITATAQFATDLGEADSVVGRLRTTLLALVPAAFIVTSLLGIWLTGRALRPVRRIADTAETIQATDLSRRLPVDGNDEFAYLSKRFNGMLERIQASFTAQRQFVSDASHELKTPLTVIKGRSGLALSSGQTAERYQEHLRAIDKAADGMAAIVGDLLLLAQADENKLALDFRPILVSQLVAEALDGTSDKTRFALDLREGLKVQADPLLARRALSNVIANAERHNDKGRPILISGHRDGDGIEIAVIDEGEGIPAEHLPNIFDRFHRVDPSRDKASGGTGLGLAIVKSIMEAHGGRVSLSSELGRGTQVRLWFPAA